MQSVGLVRSRVLVKFDPSFQVEDTSPTIDTRSPMGIEAM